MTLLSSSFNSRSHLLANSRFCTPSSSLLPWSSFSFWSLFVFCFIPFCLVLTTMLSKRFLSLSCRLMHRTVFNNDSPMGVAPAIRSHFVEELWTRFRPMTCLKNLAINKAPRNVFLCLKCFGRTSFFPEKQQKKTQTSYSYRTVLVYRHIFTLIPSI